MTSKCRTIPAMMHYMGQNRQQAERDDRGGARAGNQPRASNQLPAPPPRPRIEEGRGDHHQRIINMITGGSSLGMPSKRQRRAYARQIHHLATHPLSSPPRYTEIPISFGPEDAPVIMFMIR